MISMLDSIILMSCHGIIRKIVFFSLGDPLSYLKNYHLAFILPRTEIDQPLLPSTVQPVLKATSE